ncbi:MAG: hypothetical protein LAO51_02825 [Acidobacteriia bacterium]|nr:hypothetical protein [Terriglobia bacterium]
MKDEKRPLPPGRRVAVRLAVRALPALLCLAPFLATAGRAAFPGTNGRIAAETLRDGDWEIVTMAPEGSGVTLLTHNTVTDRQPAWSPDGSKIAFTSNRSGAFEIWVMDSGGSNVRRLLASPSRDNFPAWSPDGLEIAFARNDPVSGYDDIWVANAATGTGLRRLTATDDANETQPAFSPDGSKIAFVTDRDGDSEIYVMGSDGSDPSNLTSSSFSTDTSPDWSPDGASIAFDSDREDGSTRIFVMAADGSVQEAVAGSEPDDRQPGWSPDGRELAFAGFRGGSMAVYRIALGDPDSRMEVSDSASFGFDEERPDWQPVVETHDDRPPVADAGPDAAAECASAQGAAVTLDGSRSSDPDSTAGTDDDIVSFEWFLDFGAPAQALIGEGEIVQTTLALGTHVVTLRVTDKAGATATDEAVWTVRDTVPPRILVVVDPSVLWPPDHGMVPVHSKIAVSDACGTPSLALASVTSSEPDDARGEGDGHTVNDIQGADIGGPDLDVLLRAERAGSGAGRVYTIVYTATDGAGNAASARALVLVPHDASGRGLPGSQERKPPRRPRS